MTTPSSEPSSSLPSSEVLAERYTQFKGLVAEEIGPGSARSEDGEVSELAGVGTTPAVAQFVPDNPPRGYKRPDMLVLDDIARRVTADPELDATDLDLSCENGHVIVGGSVWRASDRGRVENAVAGVLGVASVDLSPLEVDRQLEVPSAERLAEASVGTSHAASFASEPEVVEATDRHAEPE